MPPLLFNLIIALIVVGLLLWLITLLPIDAKILQIIRVLIVVFVVIWVIYLLRGLMPAS